MNILFVWESEFKNGGGVGRVTEVLANQFIKQGHAITYFSFSKGDQYSKDGITQYFSPEYKIIDSKLNHAFLASIINSHDIDFIINQSGFVETRVLKAIISARNIADRKKDIKVFSVHHNCVKCLYEHFELIVKENYRKSRIYPLIKNPIVLKLLKTRHKMKYASGIRYAIKNSDKLVLLSDKFIPDLSIYIGDVPDGIVEGILNPAPFTEQDTESIKKNRLVYVGRINFQQKQSNLLIPIWKKLMNKHPEWEFDIVGDGDALPQLKKMAKEAGLKNIHFHGYSDPKPYLETAKLMVLPSAFEGFGMVLVEAQAYGVVPVAFNCFSAISDIIEHGKNGLLVSPGNVDEMSRKLSELMENDNNEERMVMAAEARNSIEKFSPGNITSDWMKLFRS